MHLSPRALTGMILVMALLLGLLASLAGSILRLLDGDSAARPPRDGFTVQPYDPLR
ncbi:hypothetical protein JYK14_10635 [Siccirubricoccus sp. KC 17139]|uniref:DUF2613 family protein n=1 Tax=Siccirubricoccus soli TaxID=2899147 RepID=A0ABT1D3W4_9PROT|nr:hypothetical protein [Siccirubricoccus soli]MCO6416615.1 hypothetical protein [Siccirubricoccus soli]MCP2682750.1 hypothetical protein [Siccirubricoccus soli]